MKTAWILFFAITLSAGAQAQTPFPGPLFSVNFTWHVEALSLQPSEPAKSDSILVPAGSVIEFATWYSDSALACCDSVSLGTWADPDKYGKIECATSTGYGFLFNERTLVISDEHVFISYHNYTATFTGRQRFHLITTAGLQ